MFKLLGLCFAIWFYSTNVQILRYVVANNNSLNQQQQQHLAATNYLQMIINYNNNLNRTNNNNNEKFIILNNTHYKTILASISSQQNIQVNDHNPLSIQQQELQKPFSESTLLASTIQQKQSQQHEHIIFKDSLDVPKLIENGDIAPDFLDDRFDWMLLKHMLRQDSSKNVIISPLAIKLVLSLLLEASGNNTITQNELLNVLQLKYKYVGDKKQNLSKYWKRTIETLLEKNSGYNLLFSSKIFADDGITPSQKYQSLIEHFYNSDILILPFKNSNSVQIINNWSASTTNGHIKSIVTEEHLKNAVLLVLNAIYFKGKWKYGFDKRESFIGKFFYGPTKSINVEYMADRNKYSFLDSRSLDAKIIRIPYEGDKFQLTILLPKAKGGINELINNINPTIYKNIECITDDETEVKLILPKLYLLYEISFKDILKTMGIQNIFSDYASLPVIDRGEHTKGVLKVSDICQKTGIQIDETGTVEYTEKAAATGAIEDFDTNRPFLFFIEDIKEKTILLAGKIVNPVQ